MKYLVGRACVLAGYTDLFHVLNLVLECHNAEEARESRHMAIYDAIMKAVVMYNAMEYHTNEASYSCFRISQQRYNHTVLS